VGLAWGEHEGRECLRLTANPDSAVSGSAESPVVRLSVYPTELLAASGRQTSLPPMAGRQGIDEHGPWFVPRFPFVAGTSYSVVVEPPPGCPAGANGKPAFTIVRAPRSGSSTTSVSAVFPSVASIPSNLLRLYVQFSASMSEGWASRSIHIVDDRSGDQLADATLEMEPELWDKTRRRLTVLFDPGRIKQGLVPHQEAGYPLRRGHPIRLVVDRRFEDAAGHPLRAGFERRYRVGPEVRQHVDPRRWGLLPPPTGTRTPFVVEFDRPLDHGLLHHALAVTDPEERRIAGLVSVGPEERSWAFVPTRPWCPGRHHLIVDHRLEDLAGNSLARLFDRDLRRVDQDPRPSRSVAVAFDPRD
jgi:hypothetical protein